MTLALFILSLPAASRMSAIIRPDVVTSVALLAALSYALRSARLSGLGVRNMYWAVVCSLLAGLWGGHLLSLLVHGWEGGPLALFQFAQGGKSLFGGLLLGGLAAGLYFHYRKLPVLPYSDAAIPAVALGYCIGRIGCFLNGDDYGTLSHVPWAVTYPAGTEAYADHSARGWISPGAALSLPIHPVQLYSSLVGFCLFVLLACWRPKRHGSRLCAFLVLYGTARFFMEHLRGDFRAVLGPLSLPQIFSLLFVLLGLWLKWHAADKAAHLVPEQASDNRDTQGPFLLPDAGLPVTGQFSACHGGHD
jgi:phosphatidylglycerol:prolipoprotein diacylglycerol transferase